MAIALNQHPGAKTPYRQLLPWVGTGLCLSVLVGYIVYNRFGQGSRAQAAADSHVEKVAAKKTASGESGSATVTLSDSKLKEAKLAVAPVRLDRVSTEVPVAGMIQVNSDFQVEVRPRASGVVREVHVLRGQNVKKGDPLVTLDSPEVGTARLNLRARQRDLAIARYEADWRKQVATNVAALIPQLRKGIDQRRAAVADDEEHADAAHPAPSLGTDSRSIEREFADRQLGAFRGTLLQAYAEFDIASHEEQKTALLRKRLIMGEHNVVLARHTREGIQAKLEAAVEQVRWDAAQEQRVADQGVRQAEAGVIDAAQRLRILGVTENIVDLLAHPEQGNELALTEDVTVYRITAPFDGTIVRRDAVPSQRADVTDVLFLLADLSKVWVSANVPESDVAKIPRVAGGTIRLTAVSYPGREFSAKILSVGAVVDTNTRTVPLLAVSDNAEGLLKPNMFVRIELGSSTAESALTVPEGAVREIDSVKYVFVPISKSDEGETFGLRPVETGAKVGLDRIVIKSGVKEGEMIVASGGFFLQSEFVFQNQPEEE